MQNTAVPPPEAPNKSRTKAKERYLRRKKERRKQRKSQVVKPKHTEDAAAAAVAQSSADTESDNDENVEPGVRANSVERGEVPRKRRRVSEESEVPEVEQEGINEVEVLQQNHNNQPTGPPAAFPSFPLPVAPDAPSKSTLALQGLDKALLDAQIISPSRNVPIDVLDAERPSENEGEDESGKLPILSQKMKKRLRELGINEFFAVQTSLLPFLLPPQRRLRALYLPYDTPQDVCVSAPTGSGKTLAYVVPIVEILSARIATRLRALIVLPTRDLVLQVQETLEAVSKGRGLKIGVATGQHSFAHEQTQLVPEREKILQGGASSVDILICTPGRLIDHVDGTPNFTLQHLRFLVIDEADRLLAHSFQDWLAQVLHALRQPMNRGITEESSSSSATREEALKLHVPLSHHHDSLAPHCLPRANSGFDDPTEPSCQKLLFSATLTRDPAKIAALGLRNPKYFVVQENADIGEEPSALSLATEEFAMPAELKEHYISMPTARKPLILFYLVHMRDVTNALVFTKSAASTARLVKLFEFFEEAYQKEKSTTAVESQSDKIVLQAYSSDLPPGERKTVLERFRKQEIQILVCSDLVARGLDIPHVLHVISYDAPIDLRKYVHRAGRTARAGRSGDAWTLVEDQEAHFFKKMLGAAGKARLEKVTRVRVRDGDLVRLESAYEIALGRLKEYYSRST